MSNNTNIMSQNTSVNFDDIEAYVAQINRLVALPHPHFNAFYLPAITNYLLLNHANNTQHKKLASIIHGLKLRRALILPPGASAETANEKHDIWTYGIFVSLLLYDQHTPDKQINSKWIAHTISYQGMNWLNTDRKILHTVLELIKSPNPSQPLGSLILKAHRLKTIAEHHKLTESQSDVPLPQNPAKRNSVPTSAQQQPGRFFRNWLMKEISSTSNNPNIHFTDKGLALIDPDVFQQFAKNQPDHWKTIRTDFLKLKLHTTETIKLPKHGKTTVLLITSLKKQT